MSNRKQINQSTLILYKLNCSNAFSPLHANESINENRINLSIRSAKKRVK